MSYLNGQRAAAAALIALACGVAHGALADPIVISPGSGGAGLDSSAITPFDITAGGNGLISQSLSFSGFAKGTASFNSTGVIDITSFNGHTSAQTGLGAGWELFAVFSLSGSGSWNGGTGNNFLASSDALTVQIYGVKNDPTLNLAIPTSATEALGTLESSVCGSATCIELGNGSSTGDAFAVNGGTNGQRNEVFTLSAGLTPDDAAFFDPVPLTLDLSVLSGPSDNASDSDIIGNLANSDTSKGNGDNWNSCSPASGGSKGVCPGLGNVSWDVSGTDPVVTNTPVGLPTPVPEPASLSLFGAALAGFGLFRRRQRA